MGLTAKLLHTKVLIAIHSLLTPWGYLHIKEDGVLKNNCLTQM